MKGNADTGYIFGSPVTLKVPWSLVFLFTTSLLLAYISDSEYCYQVQGRAVLNTPNGPENRFKLHLCGKWRELFIIVGKLSIAEYLTDLVFPDFKDQTCW